MKVSRLEQETTINFNEAEAFAEVYTYNKALQRKLDRLCVERSEEVKFTQADGWGGKSYVVPKKSIKVNLSPQFPQSVGQNCYKIFMLGRCNTMEIKKKRAADGCSCILETSIYPCCNYFRDSVLPAFPGVPYELAYDSQKCTLCGKPFTPKSNRAKYCPECAEKAKAEAARKRKRKQRNVTL